MKNEGKDKEKNKEMEDERVLWIKGERKLKEKNKEGSKGGKKVKKRRIKKDIKEERLKGGE